MFHSQNSATSWWLSVQTHELLEDSSHSDHTSAGLLGGGVVGFSPELTSALLASGHAHSSGQAVCNLGNTIGDRLVFETLLSSVPCVAPDVICNAWLLR